MNRLTVKDEDGHYMPKGLEYGMCGGLEYCPDGGCDDCVMQACFDKLGKLEDMAEQETKAKEPAEELPDGNVYWINDKGHIVAARMSDLEGKTIKKKAGIIYSNGPQIYTSLKEAKKALHEMKGEA